MSFRRHDVHTLSGVYALDTLEPGAEHDRFSRHLRRCQACRDEVRGLREVATSLAFAVAAEPPATMRPRVLAAVGRTRQLPPETRTTSRLQTRGFMLPRLVAAVAVVALAAIAVLAVAQVNTERQLRQARQQSQAIAAVLAAPDARILARSTDVGGVTTVIESAALRQLVVTATGLPLPAAGRVYELWLIGPHRTRPAGLLPASVAGRTEPVLATGLVPGDELAMTVEPAGGTSAPTSKPIVVVPLPP
jgi:type II secretory pathway pseudopilin PulG